MMAHIIDTIGIHERQTLVVDVNEVGFELGPGLVSPLVEHV